VLICVRGRRVRASLCMGVRASLSTRVRACLLTSVRAMQASDTRAGASDTRGACLSSFTSTKFTSTMNAMSATSPPLTPAKRPNAR
jgi:hypothetical protein